MATVTPEVPKLVKNREIISWFDEMVTLCQPDSVHWCDGSQEEYDRICEEMVESGTFIRLNPEKRPNCFLARSHESDVARVEDRTYICSLAKADAGPTNNWMAPREMKALLTPKFDGCMRGRTMYVIPVQHGPAWFADLAHRHSNYRLALCGDEHADHDPHGNGRAESARRWRVHQVPALGRSTARTGARRCRRGPVRPIPRTNTSFTSPKSATIWSYGSGYGGNALLGKKCFALRIASVLGREQGWLAEHMLITGVKNPEGEKTYVAAAFPSACGKTNFAMLIPPKQFLDEGWEVTCVGDDIAWIKPGEDGKIYAINPEAGFFGVAPGTNEKSNPNAMASIRENTIFTNVALTDDGDVWWEGMTEKPPAHLDRLEGQRLDARQQRKSGARQLAVHGSAVAMPVRRFRVRQPQRRADLGVHLWRSSRDGVAAGVSSRSTGRSASTPAATMGSETTAAAFGKQGQVRRDPLAMLPFCGYHMGDYLGHWLDFGRKLPNPPRIFNVNWFRKDADGNFLWPGFSENMRILKWIVGRSKGKAASIEGPLGWMPQYKDIDWRGLEFSEEQFEQLMSVERGEWMHEIASHDELFFKLYDRLPKELTFIRELLLSGLWRSPEHWDMTK